MENEYQYVGSCLEEEQPDEKDYYPNSHEGYQERLRIGFKDDENHEN